MKTIRVIGLPNGRAVTLGVYVRAWRQLLAMPGDRELNGWDHVSSSASEILRAIRYGVQDRINRHDLRYGKGRKWDDSWQWEAIRLARALGDRVRVYANQCPCELRARLAHRFADPRE